MTDTLTTLASLVGFPSICGTPNGPIIDWIEQRLRQTGARIQRVPGDQTGRSSLFASLGPETPDGIILSAHSDVVPVEGQNWTTDPFILTERDGKLYGRGSSDMKGFLACMLTAAARAKTLPLKRPLHLAISHDEELGCLGVRSLLTALRTNGLRAYGCVVGEPTSMTVATAHKGKIALEITCHGQAAHSANPFCGINAIVLASKMILDIQNLQNYISQTETHDTRFDVPFSTVQTGLIKGGTALNIVPDLCVFRTEIRLLPGIQPEPYLAWLENAALRITHNQTEGQIAITITNSYPGLTSSTAATSFLNIGLRYARQNQTTVIDFGTEAGLFERELNIPCLVCGPGSINRAHKADEYITHEELQEGDLFLANILEDLCHSCV
ncbi:acetylornithine deacetylase [Acetobacter malorum]|uniref:acetylornithine deacetylase n=1 Tax=Acetobacter malorum TaxID=178901 RepID=UPI00248EF741|nr:acetylornithine deacetylase [Acetobacter malorum]